MGRGLLLIGLGFTFFSGAVEAWVVDAMTATGYTGTMESVFGRGQIVSGVAMLVGSVAGGFIAQQIGLGVPFVLRGLILFAMFAVAFRLMHDVGFTPHTRGRLVPEMRRIVAASVDHGLRVPAIRWLMLENLFTGGVAFCAFYALQPYLLELYGDPEAYQIAGSPPRSSQGHRSSAGPSLPIRQVVPPADVGVAPVGRRGHGLVGTDRRRPFVLGVVALIVVWALTFAASFPIRQSYMNAMIPSSERATILSFDSLMDSAGGVWAQPVLGRTADVWGYAPSYLIASAISSLAIPFIALSRHQRAEADVYTGRSSHIGLIGPAGGRPGDRCRSQVDLWSDLLQPFDRDREELVQRQADARLHAGDLVAVHAWRERSLLELLLHARDLHAGRTLGADERRRDEQAGDRVGMDDRRRHPGRSGTPRRRGRGRRSPRARRRRPRGASQPAARRACCAPSSPVWS